MAFLPYRRKFYLCGRRVHHGLLGCAVIVVGIVWVIDDWADRWWSPVRRELHG